MLFKFVLVWFCDHDIIHTRPYVSIHSTQLARTHCPSLQPWSAVSVSYKWGLIVLNSAHPRFCVCKMTERFVRTLSDVSVIDSFLFQFIPLISRRPKESQFSLTHQRKCWRDLWWNKRWTGFGNRGKLIYTCAKIKMSFVVYECQKKTTQEDRIYSKRKGVKLALWGWQKEGRVTSGFLAGPKTTDYIVDGVKAWWTAARPRWLLPFSVTLQKITERKWLPEKFLLRRREQAARLFYFPQ